MSTPSAIHLERPYANLDAYIDGDAWTVERSDMVLVGVEGLTPGASVKFDIVLANGAPAVSGEGRVVERVAPDGGRPGGTRVRFRQLDAPSKSVLRRALDAQKRAATAMKLAGPIEGKAASTGAIAPPAESATARSEPEPVAGAVPAPTPPVPTPERRLETLELPPETDVAQAASPPSTRSGVRHRLMGIVSPPGNRDALLERLRKRAGG